MKFHALAVDDDPAVLEDIEDRLEALGHSCDTATCLHRAREHLGSSSYSYILLDLQIPVRYGRKSRIPNGQNLLREIRALKGLEEIPIIVMTTHGHDSPDLAIEVLRGNGAIDFVRKPFPEHGHTLEKAILEGLRVSGRSRPGAHKRIGVKQQVPPSPFEKGELVFSKNRVELCGVKVCGGSESGMIRLILNQLRFRNPHGRYVHYDGSDLADRVGCDRGQNGVAEAVREFRTHVSNMMLDEANVAIDRMKDVILNDRRYGYRFSPKIEVRDGDDPVNDRQSGPRDLVNDVVNDPDNNDRQRWILEKMKVGEEIRKVDIVKKFECSVTTAGRDLSDLRRRGLIEFIGAPKTGYWRIATLATRP